VIINAWQQFCSLVAAVFGVAMIETAICCAGAAPLCRGRFVINRFVRLIVERKGMEMSVCSDIS
jgi:hypothetical protein